MGLFVRRRVSALVSGFMWRRHMSNFAAKILFRLALAAALAVAAIIWNRDFLVSVFLGESATTLSHILNGFIFLLFFSGLLKIIAALLHYRVQERQADLFVRLKDEGDLKALENLSPGSLIYRRYKKVKDLHERRTPISHGAISSVTMAEESLFVSYPRFVNNILILTGVFGTIISLILALAGAGSVLKTSVAGRGMWMIISGMNTALTTTGAAIVCYFFFTYFYQKLLDAQTLLFSRIEDLTLTYIVPEFSFDAETVNYKIENMVSNILELLKTFGEKAALDQRAPMELEEIKQKLKNLDEMARQGRRHAELTETLIEKSEQMHQTMRRGFRLEA